VRVSWVNDTRSGVLANTRGHQQQESSEMQWRSTGRWAADCLPSPEWSHLMDVAATGLPAAPEPGM
jgi:hypothetical protein